MAIDLTQIQQQALDRAQSRLAEDAQSTGELDPGQSAARFEQLLEPPREETGAQPGSGVPDPEPDPARTAVTTSGADELSALGDRILANMSSISARIHDLTGTGATEPVGAKPDIDIGDPSKMLKLEIEVAEVKAEVALATTTVQKTSQGVDTLLKSQ